MLSQGLFSTLAMVIAIMTLFAGVAAITNARRMNEEKHQRQRHHEAHSG
jgi:hypothetical protein